MSQDKRPKIIVIAGPTASGKTALAVELALSLSGQILNADSMQVYRGMDIGTAKPTHEEKKGIRHHLLDVVDPDEDFNAAMYRLMALPLVRDITSRGETCFVVGGTGLYIRALLGGLMKSPPSDPELRKRLHRECELYGSGRLYERLTRLDPERAEDIHPNDKVRIIRALEIIHLTNVQVSALMKNHRFSERPINALKLCLHVDREELYRRINERSVKMAQEGLMEETRDLLKRGFTPDLRPMKAIGYRHMVKYLQGVWSLEEAIDNLKRDTRRYSKRQLAWFKAEPDAIWVDPNNFDMILRQINLFLSQNA